MAQRACTAMYHHIVDSQSMAQAQARAERVATILSAIPDVRAICLFGSAARGDLHDSSDIDLLVIGSNPELRPTSLLSKIPERFRYRSLSLICYTFDQLRELLTAASPFARHLQLQAKVLYDPTGTLEPLLRNDCTDRNLDVQRELQSRMAQLHIYENLDKFDGNFLFALSNLYSIGKSIVILALVADDVLEFNKEAAFTNFAKMHPEMSSDVETVHSLRPFHMLVTRDVRQQLPFPYQSAEREVRNTIAAIHRIASVIK
jgi:hypothetical protein